MTTNTDRCEAVTTTGTSCRYTAKIIRDVMNDDRSPLTVRVCKTHANALDATARAGGYYRGAWPLTIHHDGRVIDVWPLVGAKEQP